ncbi:MAG: thioredoxin [Firmicutes bacterium]|nr:thioredoxin [Bacillota bacterium]
MLELNEKNFQAEVLEEKDKAVLVDFWAPWCGPCRMQTPILERFAAENGDRVKVGKLNTDEASETAMRYGIMSIPTLIVFKNGAPVKKAMGVQNVEALKRLVEI